MFDGFKLLDTLENGPIENHRDNYKVNNTNKKMCNVNSEIDTDRFR